MELTFTPDPAQYAELRSILGNTPNRIRNVLRSAVNRTAAKAQVIVIRTITHEVNIKASDIRGNAHRFGGVVVKKARGAELSARVTVTGSRIPLYRFGAKQTKRGVTYRIKKGGGRGIAPSAFIATMRSGHTGVFKRKTKKRFPIYELRGPSLPHVGITSQVLGYEIRTALTTELAKNIASQVDRVLAGKGAE